MVNLARKISLINLHLIVLTISTNGYSAESSMTMVRFKYFKKTSNQDFITIKYVRWHGLECYIKVKGVATINGAPLTKEAKIFALSWWLGKKNQATLWKHVCGYLAHNSVKDKKTFFDNINLDVLKVLS